MAPIKRTNTTQHSLDYQLTITLETHLNSRNRRSQHNPPIIRHILIRLLRNKVLSLNINPKNPINIRPRNLRVISKVLDPRVTNSNIQPPEFLHQRLEHSAHFVLLGYIRFDCYGFHAMRADLLGYTLCSCCGGDIVDCDVGA